MCSSRFKTHRSLAGPDTSNIIRIKTNFFLSNVIVVPKKDLHTQNLHKHVRGIQKLTRFSI